MRDDENADQHRWLEDPWDMTSNPQVLEKIPDPSCFEKDLEMKDYVYFVLLNVIRLFFSNYVGLSESSRERIEMVTEAFMMYLEDIPDDTIASELGCSKSSVSRYRTAIEKKLPLFETLLVELMKRLQEANDDIALAWLFASLNGKSREEYICESRLEAKVVDQASIRIRRTSRKIQKDETIN